jgi:hypothetical protein
MVEVNIDAIPGRIVREVLAMLGSTETPPPIALKCKKRTIESVAES